MIETYDLVDRNAWGAGPWDGEPDRVLWIDEATGLSCLARRNQSGAWCGYVAIDRGHPLYDSGDRDTLDVHGGITYCEHCTGDAVTGICHPSEDGDRVLWFGFDCLHGGDSVPGMRWHDSLFGELCVYRTLAYVQEECATLARQLADTERAT